METQEKLFETKPLEPEVPKHNPDPDVLRTWPIGTRHLESQQIEAHRKLGIFDDQGHFLPEVNDLIFNKEYRKTLTPEQNKAALTHLGCRSCRERGLRHAI